MTPKLRAAILRQADAELEILAALREARGNHTQAAKLLGVTYRQFRYLLTVHHSIEDKLYERTT
jgi:transcriptional regulator with AAA-type ATPase domain